MPNILEKINETLMQLNEVEDLRNVTKGNNLKSLINLLNNPQTNIDLGLKIGNPDELWTNSKNPNWNSLYINAVAGKLISNGEVNSGDQYVLKLENVYSGKNNLGNKIPSSGYIKFAADKLDKFNRKPGQLVRSWAKSLNTAFTFDDFSLVQNKQAASVLSKEDTLEVQKLFRRLIKVKPKQADADKAWFFDRNVTLSSQKVYSTESARESGRIPAEFIMQLYFYLFAGENPHGKLPEGDESQWDSQISNYYKDCNEDKVKTWSGLVRKNSNLTSVNYADLVGKEEAISKLIENIKNLKVGGKTVKDIWSENLEDLTSKLDKVKNAWNISDAKFTQDSVNNSFILAAFLGGLCKNLTDNDLFNLPKLNRNLKNQFNELKPEYKNRFKYAGEFAQSILLNTSREGVDGVYADQDWGNYLKSGEHDPESIDRYKVVPSTDPEFTNFTIRSTDEIRSLLNEVFKDDDLDAVTETGNLFLLIRPSDSADLKAAIKLVKSMDNPNRLIPDNKTLPRDYNTFEFNSNDQLNICYADEGKSPSWNVNNILKSSTIKGTIGAKIKKDEATAEPIIAEALKVDLSKLQITVTDSENLKSAKIISIDSGTVVAVDIDDDTESDEDIAEPSDGSEKLTDDQIKEAMINWLWSKKPATLKTQEDVRKFIMGEYANFEDIKKAVINEVKSKPDYYTYDKNLKTFAEVKPESELQKLLDKLNDTSKGTERTKPATGNNIDDVNIPVTERAKPLKMSAQTVRQKLTELAAALAETKDETDLNKVSTETKKKLVSAINNSADLTQIVLWLNKMAGLAKKTK